VTAERVGLAEAVAVVREFVGKSDSCIG
jgi:dTDP-glucose pyrophosphorylase